MELTVEFNDKMKKRLDDLEAMGEPEHMKKLGEILVNEITPIIPADTGRMAKAYRLEVTKNYASVSWENGTPYTRYQFYGKVMGPNKAIWTDGVHTGWKSPIKPKYLTDRDLGNAHDITLKDGRVIHIKGYTNPKSRPRWTEEARTDPEIWYPIKFKMGRYIYDEWRKKQK